MSLQTVAAATRENQRYVDADIKHLALNSKPPKRWVNYEYLDEHAERHDERCKARTPTQHEHYGECRFEESKYHECRPAAIEKQCGIARQHKVVGLQLADDMQRDKHTCKEAEKENCAIDKAVLAQYFEKLFHHSNNSESQKLSQKSPRT